MVTASPAKLRDGSWGAKVQGSVAVGDTVTIRTSAGKTWTAKITKVVWTGDGITLAATESSNAKSTGYTPAIRDARGYVTKRGHEAGYCGYLCPVTGRKCCSKNGQCHDCQ